MYRFIFILVLISGQCFAKNPSPPCTSCFLDKKIDKNDKRYHTFLYAFKLMSERNPKVIVETGTSRQGTKECAGDGCSTFLFAKWIERQGGSFFSVDIDPQALKNAEEDLGALNAYVELVQSDSVAFLRDFHLPIDFLYLDSYDFEPDNPLPSQMHHLNEIIAAYPHLTDHSIVMIDDCNLPHGGKGKLAIEWLLNQGWKIIAHRYQVILAKRS